MKFVIFNVFTRSEKSLIKQEKAMESWHTIKNILKRDGSIYTENQLIWMNLMISGVISLTPKNDQFYIIITTKIVFYYPGHQRRYRAVSSALETI